MRIPCSRRILSRSMSRGTPHRLLEIFRVSAFEPLEDPWPLWPHRHRHWWVRWRRTRPLVEDRRIDGDASSGSLIAA